MTFGSVAATTIMLGSLYVLVGLSWVVIFRATQVLNIAVGQSMAFAAYLFYAASTGRLHLSFLPSLLVCVAGSAAMAGVAFLLFVRPVQSRPHFVTAVVTIGYAIVLEGLIGIFWGTNTYVLPTSVANHVYRVGDGAIFTTYGLVTTGVAILYAALLGTFVRFSPTGMRMRASSESPTLASQSGINITYVFVLAWVIAGVAMALAGVSYSYSAALSPSIAEVGLVGLVPALIGGFESIPGTVAGAYFLALVQTVGVSTLGGASENAIVGAVLLVFLILRPTGVAGQAQVGRV